MNQVGRLEDMYETDCGVYADGSNTSRGRERLRLSEGELWGLIADRIHAFAEKRLLTKLACWRKRLI